MYPQEKARDPSKSKNTVIFFTPRVSPLRRPLRWAPFSCVSISMEYGELWLVGIGTAISVIGYFLKRENRRLTEMESLINEINVTLAKNGVRDRERWASTDKRLEDRRNDVRKLYDMVQSSKSKKR